MDQILMRLPKWTFVACALAAQVIGVGYAQDSARTYGPHPKLPPPEPAKVKNFSTAGKWASTAAPKAPDGFRVSRFAEELVSPRWLYVLPNGDVLVAEASTKSKPPKTAEDKEKQKLLRQAGNMRESADRITLLRDADGDGMAEHRSVLLSGLNQPFGMLWLNGNLYVANTDGILRFPWDGKRSPIEAKGDKILTLPAGGYNNHWTRNLIANPAGTRIYVSVGSASNAAEHGLEEEKRRANILEITPDGSGERIYASGLRNPNGMDWQPGTNTLWTAVNERDNIGDDLVPDYITSVREGGFYGWPWSYFGSNVDKRVQPQRSDLVGKAIVPDFAVGAHTASLGLVFYRGTTYPERYRGGVFVGQHGSWNRTEFSGYKVIFVPFRNGRPVQPVEDFLTGFLADPKTGRTNGRPAGVAVDRTGALLVADDTGDVVWRVSAAR
jgi:glucose/arabinose dehydrogenase